MASDAAEAPIVVTAVRTSAVVFTASALFTVVLDLVRGPLLPDLAGRPMAVTAGFAALAGLLVLRVDAEEAVATGRGRRLLSLYPLVLATMIAVLHGWAGVMPTAVLAAVALPLLAGLTSTHRLDLIGTVAVSIAGVAVAAVRTPEPHTLTVAITVALSTLAAGLSATLRARYREVMRQQLRDLDEAEQLAQRQTEFVATVSHELRTPVHVIAGLIETLDARASVLDEVQRADLTARLRSNADELRLLLETLLDFSKLQADAAELAPESVDLRRMADDVLRRHTARSADHRGHVEVSTDDTRAHCDGPLIERVLDNLVSNAFRHTPAGTQVRVRVGDDRGELLVAVVDDGPGVPPDDLPRLGERFYRGSTSHLRRGTRGVGVGLALAREVLALHDRELVISSTEGTGSTFSFTLPRATATRSEVTGPSPGP